MYVGDDTAAGDGGLNEAVQLLVSSDGELQVPGGDALHFEILRRVTGQLQYLGCEIFENSRRVHGRCGSDSTMASCPVFEMSVNSSHREL